MEFWRQVDRKYRHYRSQMQMVMSSFDSVAGAGAAMVPHAIVADDIAAGRLVQWGASTRPPVEVWVLHASRRLATRKVNAFVDFVCDFFAHRDAAR